jgi:hypothetical protein
MSSSCRCAAEFACCDGRLGGGSCQGCVLTVPSAFASPPAAGGVSASHLDIAPRHAGVVFGVGNTAGTLAGLVAGEGVATEMLAASAAAEQWLAVAGMCGVGLREPNQ